MNQVDIINTLSSTVEQYTVMVVAIAAISLVVGGIGGVIPARNAAQLDPIAALRSD